MHFINRFIDNFRLRHEKEDHDDVVESIERGVVFRGTNLWVLIFAIFIASLGLNMGSIAVIIGAMLISPLMGPIMGIGLGVGTNDDGLLKKSIYNYSFAVAVSLAVSTSYFLLSPIHQSQSELLARTAPNIYDVAIALFGGFAGIIAVVSKQKGNVIPGAAIATALMPPLCTAGYGIATLQSKYFFGAMYLFTINTVFIALASLIIIRFLRFPLKHRFNPKEELKARIIILSVVTVTVLPSIYFGYGVVKELKFSYNANAFIKNEADFPGDYLLSKDIDPKNEAITLVFGGRKIESDEIESLERKMGRYGLSGAKLDLKQGFSSLEDLQNDEKFKKLSDAAENMGLDLKSLRLEVSEKDDGNAAAIEGIKSELEAIKIKIDSLAPNNDQATASNDGASLEQRMTSQDNIDQQ